MVHGARPASLHQGRDQHVREPADTPDGRGQPASAHDWTHIRTSCSSMLCYADLTTLLGGASLEQAAAAVSLLVSSQDVRGYVSQSFSWP
jgi:hypothetical protein